MKRVFSSTQQCLHVWANQLQSEGRGGQMYFEGRDLYDYGPHYLMARIHKGKGGKPFALVNSTGYSLTTSKHTSWTYGALHGLMPAFGASDPTNVRKAVKDGDAKADAEIQYYLKKVKVTSKDEIKWAFERIREAFKDATALRKLVGKAERWPRERDLDKVQAHLTARLKRHAELNTPEALAKRSVERVKRDAAKAERDAKQAVEAKAKAAADLVKQIEEFRAGLRSRVSCPGLSHELLQVQAAKNVVCTSRGAEVPLADAVALLRAIESGRNVIGAKVGGFEVTWIEGPAADPIISVGCHRILLSEARAVLGTALAA